MRFAHERIKKIIKLKRKSEKAVADDVGVHINTMYGWLRGKHIDQFESLAKMAKYLGMPMEAMFEEGVKKP